MSQYTPKQVLLTSNPPHLAIIEQATTSWRDLTEELLQQHAIIEEYPKDERGGYETDQSIERDMGAYALALQTTRQYGRQEGIEEPVPLK